MHHLLSRRLLQELLRESCTFHAHYAHSVPTMLIPRMAENVSAARGTGGADSCTESQRGEVCRQRRGGGSGPRARALVELALQVAVLADDSLQGRHHHRSAPFATVPQLD